MAIIGKNILDNLTTGMYSDSKIIYREYIQNACDQIDIAVKESLIEKEEAIVDIYINAEERYISIKDNATGVCAKDFESSLGNIADSNKKLGVQKGFRGIGRLCGLAYCKTLRFRTSAFGEDICSIMICDAKKMREMLLEDKKYSIDDIWDSIVMFSTENAETEEHFFEVELIDINDEDTELLDEKHVIEYLNFVAPLPYQNTFLLRNKVYAHAEAIKYCIDEYNIQVNGRQIFKGYTVNLKDQSQNSSPKKYDEITDLEFKDFYDDDKKLIAWMWYGLSKFDKQIPPYNLMRGLRLRSANIQIGNDDVLKDFFKEQRGNYYFVGEVFAVEKGLIPNSQRDYFNQNATRAKFENIIRDYFYNELHRIYYAASQIKNAYKSQQEYLDKAEELKKKENEHGFIDEKFRNKFQLEVEQAKTKAEKATKQLEKMNNGNLLSPIVKVKANIERTIKKEDLQQQVTAQFNKDDFEDIPKKNKYVTNSMSCLSRSERKIVSRILSIISEVASKDVADTIIERIKKEFR